MQDKTTFELSAATYTKLAKTRFQKEYTQWQNPLNQAQPV